MDKLIVANLKMNLNFNDIVNYKKKLALCKRKNVTTLRDYVFHITI